MIWMLLHLLLLLKLNADDSNAFSEPGGSSNSAVVLVPQTAVLVRCRLQLWCGIRFIGEFQRLPLNALVLRLLFVLRLVTDLCMHGKSDRWHSLTSNLYWKKWDTELCLFAKMQNRKGTKWKKETNKHTANLLLSVSWRTLKSVNI